MTHPHEMPHPVGGRALADSPPHAPARPGGALNLTAAPVHSRPQHPDPAGHHGTTTTASGAMPSPGPATLSGATTREGRGRLDLYDRPAGAVDPALGSPGRRRSAKRASRPGGLSSEGTMNRERLLLMIREVLGIALLATIGAALWHWVMTAS